jgi:hypothetical protein
MNDFHFGILERVYRVIFHSGGFAEARIVDLTNQLSIAFLIHRARNPMNLLTFRYEQTLFWCSILKL